jgi:hypothetical protein
MTVLDFKHFDLAHRVLRFRVKNEMGGKKIKCGFVGVFRVSPWEDFF